MEPEAEAQYQMLLIREQIEKQVAAIVAEKWSLLKTLFAVLIPVFAFLLGWLGVSQYLSGQGMQKLAKELQDKATAAANDAKIVQEQVSQAKDIVVNAKQTLSESINHLNKSIEILTGSHKAISETYGVIDKASQRIAVAADSASTIQKDIEKKKKNFEDDYRISSTHYQNLLKTQSDVSIEYKNILQKSQEAKKWYDELIETKGRVEALEILTEQVRRVSREILRLQSTETIVLQGERIVQVSLPDPESRTEKTDSGLSYELLVYELLVTGRDDGKDMGIEYRVKRPGNTDFDPPAPDPPATVTASYSQFKKGKEPQVFQIKGSPFEFVVEYMGQGVFIDDFTILKIRPRNQLNHGVQATAVTLRSTPAPDAWR